MIEYCGTKIKILHEKYLPSILKKYKSENVLGAPPFF